ncbi:MAG: response regulator transcription factor [Rhodocyclaceae bacterium]|nr:response regulator transcription factor [Rhodocyclaceae bacterium]
MDKRVPMRIILLEDHPIFRFGVAQLLRSRWPDVEVAEAATLAEARRLAGSGRWDLVLADLNLPDSHGLESVANLTRALPGVPLLVLSLSSEPDYALRAMQLGAAGFLAKDGAASELLTAVERTREGGRYISARVADHLASRMLEGAAGEQPHEQLSPQEYRVMLLLAQGERVQDIAEHMHLSPKTVTTYRARILDKLDVDSNVGIAMYCRERGLMSTSG